jgi:hypothetical protein
VKDIIQFHIDNNYYVNVKSIPDMIGCFVHFPSNYFLERSETNITYLIEPDPIHIEIYEMAPGKDMHSHTVPATWSSARLLVLEDILLRTLARKIAQTLIVVDDTEGKNVFDALRLELDAEDALLEKELLSKFREMILGKVDTDILNHELAEGYRLVLNCFESGGL